MRTALIRVEEVPGGFEARLGLDWDGRTSPDRAAASNRFVAPPSPPEGFTDIASFMAETEGGSPAFAVLGEALHELLHGGEIGAELERARADGPVRLLLDVVPAALRSLPWELMRRGGSLTFTNAQHPVARISSRYRSDLDTLTASWPLRVMLVVGSEGDGVDANAEVNHIVDAFRRVCGFVDLEVLRLPTRKKIREQAESMRPHVFHFVGHGARDEELGGYLRIDQRGGGPAIQWNASAVRDDLALAPPRLAILNACHSGEKHASIGTWAVADALVELGVPAVVAMQGPIRDRAAELFAEGFYGALSGGVPLDVAVARGRTAVTDVAPANRREFALPALILGGVPERILQLSEAPLAERLSEGRLRNARIFVDRVPKRRQLWERLRPDENAAPRIVAVTGPERTGKGEFLRWCLGMASLAGHPVAHVDFSGDDAVDSVEFLKELADALPCGIAGIVPDGLQRFSAELAAFDVQRQRARLGDAESPGSPGGLYRRLCELLAGATLDRSLLIGIDGLCKVAIGEWDAYAVKHLIKPIAQGAAGRVRLIVAVERPEREARLRSREFDTGDVLEISLEHFPRDCYLELTSQYLRARGYVRTSFQEELERMFATDIDGAWNTGSFELLDLKAAQGSWETEE
jgi:hypothetical protein